MKINNNKLSIIGFMSTALIMIIIKFSYSEVRVGDPILESKIGQQRHHAYLMRYVLNQNYDPDYWIIKSIGQRIAIASGQDPEKFKYFIIEKDNYRPDELPMEAFSSPGGYIYIGKGLIDLARSQKDWPLEEFLAGLIAHEIAHISLRHGIARAILQNKQRELINLYRKFIEKLDNSSKDPQLIWQEKADAIQRLGLSIKQDEELEADKRAAFDIVQAGYSLKAFQDMMKLFSSKLPKYSVSEGFSEHPAWQLRQENLQQSWNEFNGYQIDFDIATDLNHFSLFIEASMILETLENGLRNHALIKLNLGWNYLNLALEALKCEGKLKFPLTAEMFQGGEIFRLRGVDEDNRQTSKSELHNMEEAQCKAMNKFNMVSKDFLEMAKNCFNGVRLLDPSNSSAELGFALSLALSGQKSAIENINNIHKSYAEDAAFYNIRGIAFSIFNKLDDA